MIKPQAHLMPRSNTAKCARANRSMPQLTWLAAAGLLLIALLAVVFHIRRGEMVMAAVLANLAVVPVFVLWSRRGRAQTTARLR